MKFMVRNEKMRRIGFMVLLMLALFLVEANLGYGYTIDGNLTDWGVDLSAASNIGYLNSDLPSGGLDIDYTTEDNAASNIYGWQYVGPGYSYGSSSSSSSYYMEGNSFDVEAIYFDNDQYYAYIAIVQGLPIEGGTAPNNPLFLPGDIAIDIPGGTPYEYGIDIDIDTGTLYEVTSWNNVVYFPSSNPWEIDTGTALTTVDFVYSIDQNSHYVLEASIPLSSLGLSADDLLLIHWTQQCGNDSLTLNADVNPVPEPSTLLLLGTGLIGIGVYRWRRMRK